MKKIALVIASLFLALSVHAQSDIIDEVFDEYSGMDGFTVVNIKGPLLKLISKFEHDDPDLQRLSGSLKSIKILAQDEYMENAPDFHSLIYDRIDKSIYTEMMTIKEHDQDVNMLVREDGERISEFLMIVSGIEDNVLISIRGDISFDDLSALSHSVEIDGFDNISRVEEMK